jgi:predicted dithiol-disulfide oxidoreductase (DUF899 family)
MHESDIDEIEKAIDSLEQGLMENKKKLSELRRHLLRKEVEDYTFIKHDGSETKLSDLFEDQDELLLIHNMGKGCVYCTLWADGFNGVYQHLENRTPFVVVSPDDYKTQKDFAASRNWKFEMLSSHGTSFFKDMGFESENGGPMPGVSTFQKDTSGKIHRVAKASFGPGDDFCAVWHLLDLLPKGTNDWSPKYKY